ncbi:MAG TPA: hypothetical protein VIQ27_09525 [Gemmatimonadales bacterium]
MSRLRQMVGTFAFVAATGCLLATGRAGASQLVCPDPSEPGQPATAGARPNDELLASETFQRAITDVLRLEIAARFCETRPDTLTLDLGEGAFTSASTEYNLSRLFAAYRALTEYAPETALELRREDRLAGWYTAGGLAWTEAPSPAPPAPTPEGQPAGQDGPGEVASREGFHFSAGAGAGAFDQQCRDCEIDSEVGFAGFLSLGGLIDEKTALGVEGSGWTKSESGVSALVYSAMGQVTRYASATSGLFLRAGVGLVGYHDDQDRSAMGPGFSARAGYELGRGKLHVFPYVGYVRTFDGIDLKRNGNDAGFNFVISQFQFGLGVSLY